MIIRTANEGDIEAIARHNILLARETETRELDPLTVHAGVAAMFTEKSKGFYLVAEEPGNDKGNKNKEMVIGSLMITFEWSDWRNANMWWIQSVYVLEKYRSTGVFGKLFRRMRDLAASKGVCLLRLYVENENELAQKVYKSLGMRQCRYQMWECPV